MIFQNYHRHSDYTNPKIADSIVTNESYAKRAKEFGHGIISSMEHGWQGRYIETYELAQKYNLKFVFGTEAYWVKERMESDNTNAHICIFARNESGRQQINDILSEANISGFYYQPRLDLSLILSLKKEDVIITSACLGFWEYSDSESIVKQLHDHFGDSFYLEVQYHNTQKQKELNEEIVRLSGQLDIEIIMGCDSHYIEEDKGWERDDYIRSKGIKYPSEEGWYLDYPDGEEAFNRFITQGILTPEQAKKAMDNTNVFLTVEEYKNPCFEKNIKMPTLYPELNQQQKDKMLINIISEAFKKEKCKIPEEKHVLYYEEISKELQTIIDTKFSDYFLLDYELVKLAKTKGGMITPSGRGSAVSHFTNKLLGLTMIDRISAEVKMYPERFMSTTRIIDSGGIPDIDLNLGEIKPFVEAQEELLGENHVKPMLSYGTMQPKAAWKMYAKSQDVDFDVSNEVSKQIEKYEYAIKRCNTEEEKDELTVEDYIDEKYHKIFEGSKVYQGVISDYKIAPCGYLLYQGDIRKEIGLIKIKENLCCVMDGKWAEDYKFLKNDLLKVSVVDLIYRIYDKLGVQIHEVDELIKLCPPDSKVWDIYKNGWTLGINQIEQVATKGRAMAYKPTNIAELSAFVAAVRPGFKSMYKNFESREPFAYGVKAIDAIIQTPSFPQSFMMYQETQMAVLNYSGIPLTECYDIIKNIAKKRINKVLKYREQFLKGLSEKIAETEDKAKFESDELSQKIWQIIEDSARYSFNACFSGKTVIQKPGNILRFNPTIEEMFKIKNDKEYAIATNHKDLYDNYYCNGYGNALSMYGDGRIRINKIIDIREIGVRKTYKVMTENGSWVVCTDNHKFPTIQGDKKLSKLKIGDELFVKGEYEKTKKGIPTKLKKIISVEPFLEEMVYDIEMEAPSHNVISESGLVASNSHAYSTAVDSLYGAYLKTTYPKEYYECFLNILEEKGEKNRMSATKSEAESAFGIYFPSMKFRQDNRNIVAIKDRNEITNSLQSIKGFSSSIAENLYLLKDMKFDNFIYLLIYLEENSMLSSKIESLIKIQYFSEFGGNAKLLEAFKNFTKGKNLKYTKKLKEETKRKRETAHLLLFDRIEDKNVDFGCQLEFDSEVLNSLQTTYDVSKRFAYVQDLNLKFAPRVDLYCLQNGKKSSVKIKKGVFKITPFKKGDILYCTKFVEEPTIKFVNGDYERDGTMTWWLTSYQIIEDFESTINKG